MRLSVNGLLEGNLKNSKPPKTIRKHMEPPALDQKLLGTSMKPYLLI